MEELAETGRRFGMRWNSGSIAKIEAGTHKLTIQTVVVLAAALSAMQDTDVRVPDLIRSDEPIALTPEILIENGDILAAILSGETTVGEPVEEYVDRALRNSMTTMALRGIAPGTPGLPPGVTLTEAYALRQRSSESERRIARSMRSTGAWFEAWCHHLWGRSFTEERDRRAGQDANAQKRGQVSRSMKAELLAAMGVNDGDD